MPKRVPTISTVVVRDGKRVQVPAGKSFNFTDDEVKDITAISPGALRKPVNEDPAAEEPVDPKATPNAVGDKGATDDTKPGPATTRRRAAQKDATSKAATAGSDKPKSTDAAPHVEDSDDADEGGEDDDI